MPLLFCMTVYYAVLIMIAAVVREPSSPQNTSRLRDLAIGHECISLVSRMWPLMKKQSRTIARIIEQYKLVLPELDLTRGNTIRKPSGRRDGSAFEMVSFERAMSEAISDP